VVGKVEFFFSIRRVSLSGAVQPPLPRPTAAPENTKPRRRNTEREESVGEKGEGSRERERK